MVKSVLPVSIYMAMRATKKIGCSTSWMSSYECPTKYCNPLLQSKSTLTSHRAYVRPTTLRERVGNAFCDEFLAIKRTEWDEHSLQVSDWEMRRYATAF